MLKFTLREHEAPNFVYLEVTFPVWTITFSAPLMKVDLPDVIENLMQRQSEFEQDLWEFKTRAFAPWPGKNPDKPTASNAEVKEVTPF